jgi:hypothetical protein
MATHLDRVKEKMSKKPAQKKQTREEREESRRLAWQMQPENTPHSMSLERRSKKNDDEERIRSVFRSAGGSRMRTKQTK